MKWSIFLSVVIFFFLFRVVDICFNVWCFWWGGFFGWVVIERVVIEVEVGMFVLMVVVDLFRLREVGGGFGVFCWERGCLVVKLGLFLLGFGFVVKLLRYVIVFGFEVCNLIVLLEDMSFCIFFFDLCD